MVKFRIKDSYEKNKIGGKILLLVLLFPALLLAFNLFYWNKIPYGIKIAETSVGGLIPEKAELLLERELKTPSNIKLIYGEEIFEIPLDKIDYKIDYRKSVLLAYRRYKTGNILYDLSNKFKLFTKSENLGVEFDINQEKLNEYISVIKGEIEIQAKEPEIIYQDGKIIIDKGKEGIDIDHKLLDSKIIENLTYLLNSPIEIPVKKEGVVLSEIELENYYLKAEKIVKKSLVLEYDSFQKKLAEKELLDLLNYDGSIKKEKELKLIEKLKRDINSEPQNALFVFRENKVEEFKPAKDGVRIEEEKLSKILKNSFEELIKSDKNVVNINIPISKIQPQIKTEDVNNLGIKHLLGKGSSKFTGSIPARVHNIGLASSKFNGVLIKAGQIFSFNETLGDVSPYTGYKQAYIIKDGRTILGDGGGVCQVSTTLFRAVLNAGLPIIERRAHSYRVSYYEQDSPPGLDATVFAPTTDLKFKNDTPAYILIQTFFDPQKYTLVFELYGTSDARIATTTKPVVTNITAPPEDLYIDDPTLPSGVTKQIDYKAWGAKVSFYYKVERENQIIFEKTFVSNYQPWQAKFLRGTMPSQ